MPNENSDARHFEAELVKYIPHLRAFGRSLAGCGVAGDDLAQDALARALTARASFAMGTNMKAWLFMILRNQFYSEKRRSWRVLPLDPEVAEQTLVATTSATGGLEVDELRRALGMLPPDQREALVLVGAAGLAYEEVSELTGSPVGTVKSRVSRARDRLALILAEGRIDEDGQAPHLAMGAIVASALRYAAPRLAA